MNELTIDDALINMNIAAEKFVGTKIEHISIDASLKKITEYVNIAKATIEKDTAKVEKLNKK